MPLAATEIRDKLSLEFADAKSHRSTDPLCDKRGCIELNCSNQLSSGPRERLLRLLRCGTLAISSYTECSTPSWSVYMRTWVLQLPFSLHFPPDANVRVRVIHHQQRSRPRHRLKQLPHQRALLWPRVGKKQANVGDGA